MLENRNILALASVVDATRRVTDLHEPSRPHNIEQPVVRKGADVAVRHSTALAPGIGEQPVVRQGVDVAVRHSTASAPGISRCDDLTDEVGTKPAKLYRCHGSGRFANIPSTSGRTTDVRNREITICCYCCRQFYKAD